MRKASANPPHTFLFGFACALTLTIPATPAKASIDVLIEQVGADVIITATGEFALPSSSLGSSTCGGGSVPPGANGAIDTAIAAICVGDSSTTALYYELETPGQPTSIGTGILTSAQTSSGELFGIEGRLGYVASGYASSTPILSSSTFFNTTLAGLGINSLGELGTWTVRGTGETITVRATPLPLPALGLPVAYGWSRRLRRRIRTAEGI